MITSGMMSSNTPEWATPSDFFAEVNKEFRFNLDPCSTHENAKCDKHFTKEDDGLAQNWGGVQSILQSPIRKGVAKMGQEML